MAHTKHALISKRQEYQLSREQGEALTRAQHAIRTIEQHTEWSEEQEHILRCAYETLSWQTSPLGIGIEPPGGYAPQDIIHAAENFKRQLDERYPEWQDVQEIQGDMEQLGPMPEANADTEVDTVADHITPPPPTGDDCRCTNHTGPHWLYHDYWWYERNLKELERCARNIQVLCELSLKREPATYHRARQAKESAELAYQSFTNEEIPRLQEKICEMASRHLDRIPYEVLGPDFQDLHERERELLTRIRENVQKMSSAGGESHDP